jgi:hypothetical protein
VGDGSFTAARQRATSVKVYSAQEIAQGAKTGQWAKLNKQNGATFKAPVLASEKTPLPTSTNK